MSEQLTPKGKIMPRPLTSAEVDDLKEQFNNGLDTNKVTVIDDSDNIKNYNCTAWSLDCTNRPLIVPSGLKDIKDAYKDIGGVEVVRLSDEADIDIWGQDSETIQHVSRRWKDGWSSKLGYGLCITHEREELGGVYPAYGKILASFRLPKPLPKGASLADLESYDEEVRELNKKKRSQNISSDKENQFDVALN